MEKHKENVTMLTHMMCVLRERKDLWYLSSEQRSDSQKGIEALEAAANRPAFLQYLNDAPKVNVQTFQESTNPTLCGDLREYFEYDREYADDIRICEEVKDLKVSGTM